MILSRTSLSLRAIAFVGALYDLLAVSLSCSNFLKKMKLLYCVQLSERYFDGDERYMKVYLYLSIVCMSVSFPISLTMVETAFLKKFNVKCPGQSNFFHSFSIR